jgi:serine protease
MLSANPGLTTAQVISILQTTAKPFPILSAAQKSAGLIQCTTNTCGAGIVNAAAAVAEAQRQPGGIQSNNNSGGGCSAASVNGPADISLAALLGLALLWRVLSCRKKI